MIDTICKHKNQKTCSFLFILLHFRPPDQAYRPYDGIFDIIRHVRIAISLVFDHSRPTVGTACRVIQWYHVWIELHCWNIIFCQNCPCRLRRYSPRVVFDGVPRIRFVTLFYIQILIIYLYKMIQCLPQIHLKKKNAFCNDFMQ